MAAFRERQVIEWPARDVDELEVVRTRREDLVAAAEAILGDVATRAPEDRLTAAVLEAGVLGSELVDVARVLPHGLAWRAAGLGGHLRDGLERYFPREDGPNDDPAA